MMKICEGAEECKTGARSLPVKVGIQLCSEGGDTVARVTPVLVLRVFLQLLRLSKTLLVVPPNYEFFSNDQGLLAPDTPRCISMVLDLDWSDPKEWFRFPHG